MAWPVYYTTEYEFELDTTRLSAYEVRRLKHDLRGSPSGADQPAYAYIGYMLDGFAADMYQAVYGRYNASAGNAPTYFSAAFWNTDSFECQPFTDGNVTTGG